jgi:hypothetical protein
MSYFLKFWRRSFWTLIITYFIEHICEQNELYITKTNLITFCSTEPVIHHCIPGCSCTRYGIRITCCAVQVQRKIQIVKSALWIAFHQSQSPGYKSEGGKACYAVKVWRICSPDMWFRQRERGGIVNGQDTNLA